MLGTSDIQSLADLGNSFEIIRRMRIVPVELSDFIAMDRGRRLRFAQFDVWRTGRMRAIDQRLPRFF